MNAFVTGVAWLSDAAPDTGAAELDFSSYAA